MKLFVTAGSFSAASSSTAASRTSGSASGSPTWPASVAIRFLRSSGDSIFRSRTRSRAAVATSASASFSAARTAAIAAGSRLTVAGALNAFRSPCQAACLRSFSLAAAISVIAVENSSGCRRAATAVASGPTSRPAWPIVSGLASSRPSICPARPASDDITAASIQGTSPERRAIPASASSVRGSFAAPSVRATRRTTSASGSVASASTASQRPRSAFKSGSATATAWVRTAASACKSAVRIVAGSLAPSAASV